MGHASGAFTERARTSRGNLIRLVRGFDAGLPAWWLVRIDPLKYPLYQRAIQKDSINLNDFGKIIDSGFGEYPPATNEKSS